MDQHLRPMMLEVEWNLQIIELESNLETDWVVVKEIWRKHKLYKSNKISDSNSNLVKIIAFGLLKWDLNFQHKVVDQFILFIRPIIPLSNSRLLTRKIVA